MKVLITGAAGFLGRECVRLFVQNGHEVVTTDKVGDVDMSGDLADQGFAAGLPEVDVVVNCAAVQYVTKGVPLLFRERFFYRNNVVAAQNLSDRYSASGTHFIHIGTSMMYRQTGQEIYDVTSPMGGEGVYSRSKMAAQRFVDVIPGAATVIPCIIGGDGREGLFIGFVKLMKKYGIVCFPGHGDHPTHMVHVKDVAALVLLIAQTRAAGLYNAAAPDPLSIRQWVGEIEQELHLKPVRRIALPLAPISWLSCMLGYRLLAREQLLMLKMAHVLSIKKSLELGWQPKYSNARIVRDIASSIARKLS